MIRVMTSRLAIHDPINVFQPSIFLQSTQVARTESISLSNIVVETWNPARIRGRVKREHLASVCQMKINAAQFVCIINLQSCRYGRGI